MLHGLSRGIISMAQGGTFRAGFAGGGKFANGAVTATFGIFLSDVFLSFCGMIVG